MEELGQILPNSVMQTYAQQTSHHKESNQDLRGTTTGSSITSANTSSHPNSNDIDYNSSSTNQELYPHS